MLFRCCSIRLSQRSIFCPIYLEEHEILAQNEDQFVAPISEQTLGDLIWRSLDAPVSHRSQAMWVSFSFYDRMQDS